VNLATQISKNSCTAILSKSRKLGVGAIGLHLIAQRNALENAVMMGIMIARKG